MKMGFLQLGILLLAVASPLNAHAKMDPVNPSSCPTPVPLDDQIDQGDEGGSDGTGGGPPGSIPKPTPKPTRTDIQVPCINDSGAIANASDADVCKAILPKCSDLKAKFEKKIRDSFSLKIFGYYNGKDIDINTSTKTNLVGKAMPNPICSVVGHKMKFSGSTADFEISREMIGNKASCGIRPELVTTGNHKVAHVEFVKDHGSLWTAYLLGAYPWLIRRHAYDVINAIQPDLSNLGEVINTPAAASQAAEVVKQSKVFYQALSAEAKSICTKGRADLVTDCEAGALTQTDPAHKICTLVTAQKLSVDGAVPNLLIGEVMGRVQKQYDDRFATLMNFKNPAFGEFADSCKVSGGIFSTKRKRLRCLASCLFDGQSFHTFDDWHIAESSGGCELPSIFSLDGSYRAFHNPLIPNVLPKGSNFTVNRGFAGFIEKMIRTEVCQQSKVSDDNPCDKVNIPSEPEK